MWIPAAIESSKKKRSLLRDPNLRLKVDSYFRKDWRAKAIRQHLEVAGADLPLLDEFAIWTFHDLANDEARGKLTRGKEFKRGMRKAIAGLQSAIEALSLYTKIPGDAPAARVVSEAFEELAEQHRRVATRDRELLQRAESGIAFNVRRLGANWNRQYIFGLKAYIFNLTGWNDRQILSAITHLVSAAHKALDMRVPSDLRVLLRKALWAFEKDPQNKTAISLFSALVANPRQLYRLFPPVSASTPQAAA